MAKKKTAAKKTTAKKKKISPEVGRWNNHKFKVSSKIIRGFNDLQIKGSSETEDMEKDKDVYVKRKNGQPVEVSMTVYLNAMTGCDVRKESIAFVREAKAGAADYFYIGGKKLIQTKLLLTSANVKEVQIAPGAKWVRADVQLTFKQTGKGGKAVNSDKSSGSSSGGGGGSGGSGGGGGGSAGLPSSAKTSVRTASPTQIAVPNMSGTAAKVGTTVGAMVGAAHGNAAAGALVGKFVGAVTGSVAGTVKNVVGNALGIVQNGTINPAKKYSAAKKPFVQKITPAGGRPATVARL